jgi:carboxypeptidase C (cathepsin A)
MRKTRRHGLLAFAAALALAAPALGAEPAKPAAASVADLPAPREFVTHHTTTIRGQKINYTATAGEMYLTDRQGKPTASFFSFTYIKDGPRDPSRPVMFVFNGGPGSSSVWLHLGIVGPKRVVLSNEVNPRVVPPFGLRDNPYSVLDVADLVFIDPVGTGFSRALGDKKQSDFFSVDADAISVAEFMELWLTRYGRWNSPKFVLGESYGSVRASVLPRALMGGSAYGDVMRAITLNGIVMLGTTLEPRDANIPSAEETAAMGFAAIADTAWYHKVIDRKGRDLQAFDAEAKQFAQTDYLSALVRADAGTLPSAEMRAAAEKVSGYTGVPVAKLIADKLKISPFPYAHEVLASRGLDVGVYDSRYTLPTRDYEGDHVGDDPAMAQYTPGFVAAFHDLLTNELKVDMPMQYGSIVWTGISRDWDWKRSGVPAGQSFAKDLAMAMRRNPDLRLLVAAGYYDLQTPPLAAEHSIKQGGVPMDRTTYRAYESGHMLYLGDTAEAFSNDVRALITGRK